MIRVQGNRGIFSRFSRNIVEEQFLYSSSSHLEFQRNMVQRERDYYSKNLSILNISSYNETCFDKLESSEHEKS